MIFLFKLSKYLCFFFTYQCVIQSFCSQIFPAPSWLIFPATGSVLESGKALVQRLKQKILFLAELYKLFQIWEYNNIEINQKRTSKKWKSSQWKCLNLVSKRKTNTHYLTAKPLPFVPAEPCSRTLLNFTFQRKPSNLQMLRIKVCSAKRSCLIKSLIMNANSSGREFSNFLINTDFLLLLLFSIILYLSIPLIS